MHAFIRTSEAEGTVSMTSITKSLVTDGCIWEIPKLTTAIIQCLWSKVSSLLCGVSSDR